MDQPKTPDLNNPPEKDNVPVSLIVNKEDGAKEVPKSGDIANQSTLDHIPLEKESKTLKSDLEEEDGAKEVPKSGAIANQSTLDRIPLKKECEKYDEHDRTQGVVLRTFVFTEDFAKNLNLFNLSEFRKDPLIDVNGEKPIYEFSGLFSSQNLEPMKVDVLLKEIELHLRSKMPQDIKSSVQIVEWKATDDTAQPMIQQSDLIILETTTTYLTPEKFETLKKRATEEIYRLYETLQNIKNISPNNSFLIILHNGAHMSFRETPLVSETLSSQRDSLICRSKRNLYFCGIIYYNPDDLWEGTIKEPLNEKHKLLEDYLELKGEFEGVQNELEEIKKKLEPEQSEQSDSEPEGGTERPSNIMQGSKKIYKTKERDQETGTGRGGTKTERGGTRTGRGGKRTGTGRGKRGRGRAGTVTGTEATRRR